MYSNGMIPGKDAFHAIRLAYLKNSREMVGYYETFADMYDGIDFNFHDELRTVDIFLQGIDHAIQNFHENLKGSPMIPDWKRVESAIDHVLIDLSDAIEFPV
jgi:glucosyl-3-phosphoglycerate synthase